jgi:hypothetical protein
MVRRLIGVCGSRRWEVAVSGGECLVFLVRFSPRRTRLQKVYEPTPSTLFGSFGRTGHGLSWSRV